MHCLMSFYFCLLLLLITCSKTPVEAVDMYDIQNDIEEFNKTCSQDKCENPGSDSLSSRSCHCGQQCVQLGTCCPGSYYADVPQPKLKSACRSVYNGETYFMMDDCPSGSALASLCKEEWNKDNDIQKLVPVTSMSTAITYKNYFCFRCHESHDDFLYWIVTIQRNLRQIKDAENSGKKIYITYYKDKDTWMGKYDGNVEYFPVEVSINSPSEIIKLTHICEQDLISDCSDEWSGEEVRLKCHSYMSMKLVKRNSMQLMYRNIHCALCNFESLNDAYCRPFAVRSHTIAGVFSLSNVIDVNPDGGEKVGKKQLCADDQTWDPYFERCRNFTLNEN